MAQEHLDHPDIDLLLQEMGREAVPERVQAHPLVDPGSILGAVEDATELASGERSEEQTQAAVAACELIVRVHGWA